MVAGAGNPALDPNLLQTQHRGGGKPRQVTYRPNPQVAAQIAKSGFFVVPQRVVLEKMPNPTVMQNQAAANKVLQSVMAAMVKGMDPLKKKSSQEILEETEKLEAAMDDMENTLDEILKLPGKNEKGSSENEMNREDHLEIYFENMEAMFKKMIMHQANADSLALVATIFYERLSKPKFNTQAQPLLARFFTLQASKAPSPLQAELMYNYLLDLSLRYPKDLSNEFVKPLKVLTDYFKSKPRGIPGVYAHLMGIEAEHQHILLNTWVKMVDKFPFTLALPALFGEEGCNAIAQWCWDLYLNTDNPEAEALAKVEVLTKGFGSKFKHALNVLSRNLT